MPTRESSVLSPQSSVLQRQPPIAGPRRKTQDSGHKTIPLISSVGTVCYPRLEQIVPSATNPRKDFGAETLDELAASIQAKGVIEPIIVRPAKDSTPAAPRFELVAGERRWRASKLAGKETIPALVRADLSDNGVAELQIIENAQREDLNPYEEACGYQRLVKEYGYTVDQVAAAVGKQKRTIYARLQLTRLTAPVCDALRAGKLDASRGLVLARLPDPKQQAQAMKEILDPGWSDSPMSTREAEEHIQREYMRDLRQAPFKLDDANLLPCAGACTICPKNTRNMQHHDGERPSDRCTDPECYEEKRTAWDKAKPADPVRTRLGAAEDQRLADYQKKQAAENKHAAAMNRVAVAALEQIFERAVKKIEDPETMWTLLCWLALDLVSWDAEALVLKAHGFKGQTTERGSVLRKYLTGKPYPVDRAVFFQLLAAGSYNRYGGGHSTRLKKVAQFLGVDLKKLEKTLTKAAKP